MVEIKVSEYRCAYKEVITILNVLGSMKNLIPNEKIKYYEDNMDKNHKFEFDYSKTINEQNILYPTKCILANLFKNYIATEEDRKEIIKREQEERRVIESKKRELYNPNNIFENKTNSSINSLKMNSEEQNNNANMSLVTENRNIFSQIKAKILSFIKIFK